MDELLHNDYSNDAAGLQINFFGYAQKLTKPNDLLVFNGGWAVLDILC